MKINYIQIKNFKSIKNCNLKLKNHNIILGYYGAGKSNFLSVFKMINNLRCNSLNFLNFKNYIVFKNETEIERLSNEIDFKICYENNINECYKIILNDKPVIKTYLNFKDKTLIGENFIIYDLAKTINVSNRNKINDNALIKDDFSNLSSFLFKLKNKFKRNYKNILHKIKLFIPELKDLQFEINFSKDEVSLYLLKTDNSIIDVNKISSEYLSFICLTTLFLQPKILQPSHIIIDNFNVSDFALKLLIHNINNTHKQIILVSNLENTINYLKSFNLIKIEKNNESIFIQN